MASHLRNRQPFAIPVEGSGEAISYYRYLFQNSFQCFTDIRQAANGFHACGFQSSKFLIRSPFPPAMMAPTSPIRLPFGAVYTSDVTHNWLGNMLFDVRCRFFLSSTIYRRSSPIITITSVCGSFSNVRDVDKVEARDRVTADTNTGRLTKTVIRGLFNRFIGQCTRTGNDTPLTRFVNVTRLDTDFAFTRSDNARAVQADRTNAGFVQFHFHSSISSVGMPSVMVIISLMPASIASRMESLQNGAGT